MRFDYIRAIDPPAPDEPITPLEPLQLEPLQLEPPTPVDDTGLDALVASACHGAATNARLDTPEALVSELPSFLGVSLACTQLEPARSEEPLLVEPPRAARVWLAPGVITMAIAVAATLAFSVFVIMR